ncbi:sigma-70 family RNA polymerase sigma factor [Clostridium cochlearium]|uniref:sigma-70 family RNA polymerase sigma factor n=1 Tax=Clostridium cochlearium TaxID=1494 RepID=UPI001FA90234|nr:sigma-70 family RNA polymerase sigma factor [Clostridium cochlearium]
MKEEITFRNMERMLYNYFIKDEIIKSKKQLIQMLEKQIDKLEEQIKTNNVKIEPELNMGISYDEKVQTSTDGTSYAEKAVIRAVEGLEMDKAEKLEEIFKLEKDIMDIERESKIIELNVGMLSEEDKRFIEMKYKERMSVEEIAERINLSRTAGYNKRDKIVENIIHWNKVLG